MRKIITIMAIITMLAFSGCTSPPNVMENQINRQTSNLSMFIVVEETSHWMVVYHKDTKVMYAVSDYSSHGIFTLLVNSDGSPMLWEGDINE